ncbi:MAG: hypothetical protein R3F43_28040 [bacterium]
MALAGGRVVGIGDGSADGLVTVYAYNAACDADGDTYLDCDRPGCCDRLAGGLTGEFSDCHDDPAIAAPSPPDAKRRQADSAHPFAPASGATTTRRAAATASTTTASAGIGPADAVDADR